MAPFELAQPEDLQEAIALLDAQDTRALSGGTALMLMMKAGVLRPKRLVSLHKLGFDSIDTGPAGELRVGGMTTLSTLEKSSLVRKGWPVLTRTLRTLSNVRVRNVATVGGNLAHADPHMDLPPLLCALGARVVLRNKDESRTLAVEQISTGYLETSLRRGELITALEVPPAGHPDFSQRRDRQADTAHGRRSGPERRQLRCEAGGRGRPFASSYRERHARLCRLQEAAAAGLSRAGDP